jgi:Ca-activated chloride channel family protein
MRLLPIPIFLALCRGTGVGQNSKPDDLPSAPSAVQQNAPATKPVPSFPAPPPPPPAEPGPTKATKAATSTQTPDSDPSIPTITKLVNEVNVVFTVTDRHNHYVKDLAKSDFKVVDDERLVPEIRSFRRETDLPLQVGLLIDASNSIRDRFKFEQECAIEFLNDTIRHRFDQAFVIGFDEKPELTQDFTDNIELLSNGVRMLHPGGGTALFDAIYYASRDKLLKSRQSDSVRRALIVVSDGDDNASHVTREEAIEMALRADVIVYTISTNFPDGGAGDKVLERIADATGGRAFQPFQLSEVANAFTEIQDDLRSQYALSYHPTLRRSERPVVGRSSLAVGRSSQANPYKRNVIPNRRRRRGTCFRLQCQCCRVNRFADGQGINAKLPTTVLSLP